MSDGFDDLMHLLDPEEIARRHSTPIREALQALPVRRNTVESYAALVSLTCFSFNFINKRHSNHDVDLTEAEAYGEVRELLGVRDLLPFHNQCVRGLDGGVSAFLNRLIERYEDRAIKRYVDLVLEDYLPDPHAFDQIEELMFSYKRKFGQYLPFNLRDMRVLCNNWKQVMRAHADLLSAHRSQVGQI